MYSTSCANTCYDVITFEDYGNDHLNISRKEHEIRKVSNCDSKATCFPVDKRCRFKVYKASIRYCRRRIDVETTSCFYMFRDYHYSSELALDQFSFPFLK